MAALTALAALALPASAVGADAPPAGPDPAYSVSDVGGSTTVSDTLYDLQGHQLQPTKTTVYDDGTNPAVHPLATGGDTHPRPPGCRQIGVTRQRNATISRAKIARVTYYKRWCWYLATITSWSHSQSISVGDFWHYDGEVPQQAPHYYAYSRFGTCCLVANSGHTSMKKWAFHGACIFICDTASIRIRINAHADGTYTWYKTDDG